MQLTSFLQNGQLTIALSGEIDHHRAKRYIQSIESKIQVYTPTVCILDFRDVSFMDSSGIGVLLGRVRELQARGGTLSVQNMQPSVEKLFRLSGLNRVIGIIHPTKGGRL